MSIDMTREVLNDTTRASVLEFEEGTVSGGREMRFLAHDLAGSVRRSVRRSDGRSDGLMTVTEGEEEKTLPGTKVEVEFIPCW